MRGWWWQWDDMHVHRPQQLMNTECLIDFRQLNNNFLIKIENCAHHTVCVGCVWMHSDNKQMWLFDLTDWNAWQISIEMFIHSRMHARTHAHTGTVQQIQILLLIAFAVWCLRLTYKFKSVDPWCRIETNLFDGLTSICAFICINVRQWTAWWLFRV